LSGVFQLRLSSALTRTPTSYSTSGGLCSSWYVSIIHVLRGQGIQAFRVIHFTIRRTNAH
jgi:hypothetical protein